ncbi:site-specific tyrosine recombinase XerC [Microbulbifer rhizosphaerae]|uniref:Integrase/recombinase XerD n=1 Tax=Microbulbifer rhizosphaerae TaxID=1562603 RepID=A0A7W4WF38_9GAMM|nr:site-specific tyrosine recombinase XerC [Microbulbifer rhizosphaerae]MBB3062436.1 integrase/recombinase XerD [Microbulbifer rhizosphaerae]MBB3062442.1 integrase/recombinase XerD [Microbulbifer rhizosphaerae]
MDNQSLTYLSRLHLDYLRAMNYSPRTISHRETTLRQFSEWCQERGIVKASSVTKPILERYRRHLHHSRDARGNPISANNQLKRLVPLRSFFKWATQQNYLLYNPASELQLPKVAKALPRAPLTAEEAEQVLAQPDLQTDEGIRDRAMMEVLYSTGIRRMELLNLTRPDVNGARQMLAVRQGKGQKDRFVPIGPRALEWLQHYLTQVRLDWVIEPEPETLFLEPNGQPMTSDKLSRLVARYITRADLGKTGSCHLFRHTAATLMLENGADLRFIQQLLGHKQLSTTEIYTHVSILKLQQIHAATHPTARGQKAGNRRQKGGEEPEATEDTLLAQLEAESAEEQDPTD